MLSAGEILKSRAANRARLEKEAPNLCQGSIGVEFCGGPLFVVVREHLLQFLDEIAPAK